MNIRLGLACLLLLLASASHAELGRLFYTPQQRAGLEKARLQNRTSATSSSSTATRPVTYDGILIRSDGRTTRWVNGTPRAGGPYELEARGKTLKPGQTLAGNRVYEAHGIHRPQAKEIP
jgi:hypothetical protein